MKKIFYFIASAIVALGAVACQNDIEENIENNQQTEGLSIKVTIDEQTRVDLGVLNAENKRKLTFTDGDVLVARANRYSGTNYFFTYTQTEGDVYTFTCTNDDVSELIGTKPYFFYLGGLHEQVNELLGHGYTYFCNTAAEDISGIGLYASNKDYDHNQKNLGEEGHKVSLHALPLLKFNANEPVKFESDHASLFFVDGWKSSYTTTKTGEIYLPIMSSSGNECTVTVTTESGFNKTFKKVLGENTIYNLGTIAVPNVLYLNPGIWREADAWFAAYFFNKKADAVAAMTRAEAEDTKWVKMTDEDVDGIYECEAPAGYDSVIFTRMNPEYTECAWDVTEGEGESFKVLEDRVWNQTANLDVPAADAADNTYAVTDWDKGNWGSKPVAAQWGLSGIAGNWDTDVVMESVAPGVFAAKNVNIAKDDTFKVRKDNDWAESYGAGEVNTIEPGHFVASVFGGYENDFMVSVAGTYDVYFDYATKYVYVVNPGADYTTAKEQTANPSIETVPGQPSGIAIIGDFAASASWTKDVEMLTTKRSDLFVASKVKFNAGQVFKIRTLGEWNDAKINVGRDKYNYLETNKFFGVAQGGDDIAVAADGIYDVYFDKSNMKVYLMTTGVDYATAKEQTANGNIAVEEETPDQPSTWGVACEHNSWGDTNPMVTTTQKNLFVAKSIKMAAYEQFKIKVKGTWDGSYGKGEYGYVNKNSYVTAAKGGGNIAVVEAGTYDLYFDSVTGNVYLMEAGTSHTEAVEQTKEGPAPDLSGVSWGLCGSHNNWGTPDTKLEWDGNIKMYVAKSAKLTGEFKVRANQTWSTNYGGSVTINATAGTTLTLDGSNIKANGTYDVYFSYDNSGANPVAKLWIKTPGKPAPTE